MFLACWSERTFELPEVESVRLDFRAAKCWFDRDRTITLPFRVIEVTRLEADFLVFSFGILPSYLLLLRMLVIRLP